MRRLAEVPLDSYRLAAYAQQVPCYICDGPNAFDAQFCRHCGAPMALATQTSSKRYLPQMAAVIGASGVGKTVYLGMLMDMLSRRRASLQVFARGVFSINLQQTTVAALQQCEFPAKTPSEPDQWHWVHCVVHGQRSQRPVELMLPDMAGEAIAEAMEHPQTFPVIRALLAKCSGMILLLDSVQLRDGIRSQEHFAMKFLTSLHEINADKKTGWPARPISIVLSKADQIDDGIEDPEAFIREHAPGVLANCQERFAKFRFFATGVAGACAFRTEIDRTRRRIPLRIEPRGVQEPFAWLLDSFPKAKKAN